MVQKQVMLGPPSASTSPRVGNSLLQIKGPLRGPVDELFDRGEHQASTA
jgi:hypothetical protein